MKKHNTRQKVCHDPVIVSRVKMYLAENMDKTFVDVSQMAYALKERYSEYSRRPDSTFCQLVENAYQVVLNSYGLNAASTSEGSEESDLELLDESKDIMNNRLLEMYKMQHKKRSASNRNTAEKSSEPIDIISSDEDGSAGPKLPKINDQITVTPHIPLHNTKSGNIEKIEKQASNEKKHKPDIKKKKDIIKKKFDNLMPQVLNVTLYEFAGLSEIMLQISDIIFSMKYPKINQHFGIKAPRGALLHGPPGTGKTLLAHTIAGTLNLPFFSVAATELVGAMSGESEERIREIFERAAVSAPSILFIDEIDSIGGNRLYATKDMERRMVSQLISCLDNINENSIDVLVLVATNNADNLDPALRRAGRLEQEIILGLPTIKTRKEILEILCKKLPLDNNFDINSLALLTPGFVGADLLSLLNKACMSAVRRAIARLKNKKQSVLEKDSSKFESENSVINGENVEGNEKVQENIKTPNDDGAIEKESPSDDPGKPDPDVNYEEVPKTENKTKENIDNMSIEEMFDLLKSDISDIYDDELKLCKIEQEDFLKALKTTKPCSIREGIITVPDVTWDDIGSLSTIREDLELAVLAPVKYPDLLEKCGLTPNGVLLFGPPGCGKTLLAKAIANEAGVNFIAVKGPELLNMYVGESERAVRTCFRRARNSAPCVIFFDEFDALCPRRNSSDNNGAARVVNQLLTEMDGFETRKGVFVLAASNRPDIIDPAVLRPGRLDRILYVGMPDKVDREDILKKLTKNGTQPPIDSSVDLQIIADLTQGYTGADLAGLVRAATENAMKNLIKSGTLEQDFFVTFDDFRTALSKCKPSVSAKDQLHYEKLRIKYASGTDDKDMEMETEPVNEECMETV